jgi:uncharacterized membrane protein
MPLLLLLAGAMLGGLLGRRFEAVASGALIGFIIGYLLESRRKSQAATQRSDSVDAADPLTLLDPRVAERVRAMERRIAALETVVHGKSPDVETTPRTAATSQPAPATSAPIRPEGAEAAARDDGRSTIGALRADARPSPAPAYARSRATAAIPLPAPGTPGTWGAAGTPDPPGMPRPPGTIAQWISSGNMLARVGVVVLFIGVAFLLKYASERVTIPIEARLAAVALGGIALLAFGWRLRTRRAGYAVTLQGAGAGILYLTVFAALRLYAVLSPPTAFALLLGVGALSSFLAIRQDAMALAVLGVLGGFGAPILAASGGGHVMLFSYYAMLNAAILAIAWFKAWRLLNVVGFACTVIAGTLWGVTTYRAEDFATTEPFLILFFLFYVAIATLYALRRSLELRRYVDATLVFGTPLVAAGLQDGLVHGIDHALAWSAAGASTIYVLLARLLRAQRPGMRLLVEAFAALAIVFATLAVPLALDARLTSATWALEGAAIVWMGVRQAHPSARAFGLLLQLGAGAAFAVGFAPWGDRSPGALPIANSAYLGALIVACGGLASGYVLSHASAIRRWERAVAPVIFAWGLAWWFGAGWHEIDRFVASGSRISVLAVFLAATAVLFATLAARLGWPIARVPAHALPGVLFLIALDRVVFAAMPDGHLLAGGGWIAWPLALATEMMLLRHLERDASPANARAVDAGHAIVVWLVTLLGAEELAWFARMHVGAADWPRLAWGVVAALVLLAIATLTRRSGWPFGARAQAYVRGGAVPVVMAALLWTLVANVASAGDFAPWPFVPLANPLDVVQVLVFVTIALWLRRMREATSGNAARPSVDTLGIAAGTLLLFWITCSTLRAVHHLAGVPWSLVPLWTSQVVQSALSLVWSLFALAAMVVANRRGYRIAWVGGAVLLGLVVAKLFAVDLAQVNGVERIVSFIGVGALLLVIGYVAPVPPRAPRR